MFDIVAITTVANVFSKIWIGWGVMFLVVEFYALWLRRKYPDQNWTGGTLSEFVWRNVHKYNNSNHRIRFMLFMVFWIWLTLHFIIVK
jgi:hypothetical protein